jgi:hypothetical protein
LTRFLCARRFKSFFSRWPNRRCHKFRLSVCFLTKWVTWVVSIATMPDLVVHHCLYSQFSCRPFLITWLSLFFNVHGLFWNSNMWPYEIALLIKNIFKTILSTCNTSMKVLDNILCYFHGNVHITLSYNLLNWAISHVNLYKDDILIIMKPFFMKKYVHQCSRINVPCICVIKNQ